MKITKIQLLTDGGLRVTMVDKDSRSVKIVEFTQKDLEINSINSNNKAEELKDVDTNLGNLNSVEESELSVEEDSKHD